jgi:MerR family transcriptional regulator, redox-sensitive transcriptional activator SoxR
MAAKWLAIGEVAARTGLAVSAIRYYETQGLVAAVRNSGGQRRFLRADIRRLSFVMIAQRFGFSLERIREVMANLPNERTPTRADWNMIATVMRGELDERIDMLTRLRDKLDGCIGCGCMSLDRCTLYNPDDEVSERGAGPRHVLES